MTSSLLVCVARACKWAQYTFTGVSFSAYWASQLPLTVSLGIGRHLPLYAVFQTFELKETNITTGTKQTESIEIFLGLHQLFWLPQSYSSCFLCNFFLSSYVESFVEKVATQLVMWVAHFSAQAGHRSLPKASKANIPTGTKQTKPKPEWFEAWTFLGFLDYYTLSFLLRWDFFLASYGDSL